MYPLHYHNFPSNYWKSKPHDFQILNICSELQRAQNWIEKKRIDLVNLCYDRALELIDLTRDDPSWKKALRELSRAREFLARLRIEKEKNLESNSSLLRNIVLLNSKTEALIKPLKNE